MSQVSDLPWVKPSHSDEGGNNCVEIAATENAVAVHDSKIPTPVLTFSREAFTALKHDIEADLRC